MAIQIEVPVGNRFTLSNWNLAKSLAGKECQRKDSDFYKVAYGILRKMSGGVGEAMVGMKIGQIAKMSARIERASKTGLGKISTLYKEGK